MSYRVPHWWSSRDPEKKTQSEHHTKEAPTPHTKEAPTSTPHTKDTETKSSTLPPWWVRRGEKKKSQPEQTEHPLIHYSVTANGQEQEQVD